MTSIEDVLAHHRLGLRLHLEHVQNPWFQFSQAEAEGYCELVAPYRFAFCDAPLRVSAGVFYADKLIVCTARMFQFLCSLSDRVTTYGDFGLAAHPPLASLPRDAPAEKRSLREILLDHSFDTVAPLWKQDNFRGVLFLELLSTLFRFVIFHELGHAHLNHGARGNGSTIGETDGVDELWDAVEPVDSLNEAPTKTPSDILDRHARELAADVFAFDKAVQYAELSARLRPRSACQVAATLLATPVARKRFILLATNLYFQSIEPRTSGALPLTPAGSTHPPAPFRLSTLAAMTVPGRKRKTLTPVIERGVTLISQAFGRAPERDFFERINSPEFHDHYTAVRERIPQWMPYRPPATT